MKSVSFAMYVLAWAALLTGYFGIWWSRKVRLLIALFAIGMMLGVVILEKWPS